jgi:hypothetical protein
LLAKNEGNVEVDSKPKKVKVSTYDLGQIKDAAQAAFINKRNDGLEANQFTTKCYLDAVVGFLNRNGVSVTMDYKHEQRYHDTVGDED